MLGWRLTKWVLFWSLRLESVVLIPNDSGFSTRNESQSAQNLLSSCCVVVWCTLETVAHFMLWLWHATDVKMTNRIGFMRYFWLANDAVLIFSCSNLKSFNKQFILVNVSMFMSIPEPQSAYVSYTHFLLVRMKSIKNTADVPTDTKTDWFPNRSAYYKIQGFFL